MTTVACPNGHQSADLEWCDTCGSPIGGPVVPAGQATAAAPSAAVSAPARPPERCPHCSTLNPASALFCESCGFDFTTGQAPPEPTVVALSVAPTTPAPPVGAPWVLIIEIDPDWFALKGELADQPCPPAATRTVSLAAHTSLVGRSSQSKNVHPEIALDGDTGVSRRHAQFVREAADDGLAVVDLSSTNGTYVVEAGQLPTAQTEPIATGTPVLLHDGDRVYVGAWSKLTVRRTG